MPQEKNVIFEQQGGIAHLNEIDCILSLRSRKHAFELPLFYPLNVIDK